MKVLGNWPRRRGQAIDDLSEWFLTKDPELSWSQSRSLAMELLDDISIRRVISWERLQEKTHARHTLDIPPSMMPEFRAWLEYPNGSHSLGPRMSVDAVMGGGLMVHTRPFTTELDMRNGPPWPSSWRGRYRIAVYKLAAWLTKERS